MPSKKKLLLSAKIYLILDTQVNSYPELLVIAKKAVSAGVSILQLRDKQGTAKDILSFSKALLKIVNGRCLFIINDRVDLAKAAAADGVHLGQDDLSIAFARQMLGAKAIIGTSAQTYAHAQRAQRQGADYIGFGSVFKTLTKPKRKAMDLNLLKKVIRNISIPIFPIGGINLENISILRSLGIERYAVCRAVCEARNVSETVKEFLKED